MNRILEKCRPWLLPAVLILFILQMVMLPYAAGYTYAGRSDAPDHILNYYINSLRWATDTDINEDGVAELSLFRAEYFAEGSETDVSVRAEDGRNVVAPGTSGHSMVRFQNKVAGPVRVYITLYGIKSNDALPVRATLEEMDGFEPSRKMILPEGVAEEQVFTCVTGWVGGRAIQDIDVNWQWDYFDSETQDIIDTMLGSQDTMDDITVGLYIVVEDSNDYSIPKTADSGIGMYLVLMAISGLLLILLLLERRKEQRCEA